jgi:hypothetical protein
VQASEPEREKKLGPEEVPAKKGKVELEEIKTTHVGAG